MLHSISLRRTLVACALAWAVVPVTVAVAAPGQATGGHYPPGGYYGYGGPMFPPPPRMPMMGAPYGHPGWGWRYAPRGGVPYAAQPGYGAAGHAPAAAAASAAATAAADPVSGAVEVTIAQMRFQPSRLTVKRGTEVTWQQVENMPHTVTAGDGSFGSQRLSGGDTFSHTFDEPGTYPYVCSIHPTMRGEIVVVD